MGDLYSKTSLAIQAGGSSSRIGEDKALKLFLGEPLIQRIVKRLVPFGDEVFMTTNNPKDYAFLNLRMVADPIPGKGALGGLYTALVSACHPIVAVVACDMPFASAALLKAAEELMMQRNADAVIPRTANGLEPLHAVYRRETCLPVVQSAIKRNHLKVIDWFSEVNTIEQSLDVIAAADPTGLAFWNINTLEEFHQAEEIARRNNI